MCLIWIHFSVSYYLSPSASYYLFLCFATLWSSFKCPGLIFNIFGSTCIFSDSTGRVKVFFKSQGVRPETQHKSGQRRRLDRKGLLHCIHIEQTQAVNSKDKNQNWLKWWITISKSFLCNVEKEKQNSKETKRILGKDFKENGSFFAVSFHYIESLEVFIESSGNKSKI